MQTTEVGDATSQVEFPRIEGRDLSQDEEWCWIRTDGGRRKIRLHDYHELYDVPGLYEHVFYDKLRCNSPETVCGLLQEELARHDEAEPSDLRVLDVGAGNGMVGEVLSDMGAEAVVGIDIITEAARAAERDRPGLYDQYHVADLTDLPAETRADLADRNLNCLATVAALGFGDIPPLAFAEAYNLIAAPGWLAFNIKEDFVDRKDSTGFSRLVRRMAEEERIEVKAKKRYQHRLSTAGEPLHYMAVVAEKRADVPGEWLESL